MLGRRLRRQPNIKPALTQRLLGTPLFVGKPLPKITVVPLHKCLDVNHMHNWERSVALFYKRI